MGKIRYKPCEPSARFPKKDRNENTIPMQMPTLQWQISHPNCASQNERPMRFVRAYDVCKRAMAQKIHAGPSEGESSGTVNFPSTIDFPSIPHRLDKLVFATDGPLLLIAPGDQVEDLILAAVQLAFQTAKHSDGRANK